MTRPKDKVDINQKNTALHQCIKTTLMRRYDTPVMNNVYRANYVECLIAFTIGNDWWLTWTQGWDWAAWDCQHTSGARLEIKQAAVRQSWDREAPARRRTPRFDIADRTGYWTQDGSRWVNSPGRPADLYVFAWHDEGRVGYADHRDTNQWLFFVVAEQDLPKNQTIGLGGLKAIVSSCRIAGLKRAVENSCPARVALKATLEHV